MKKQPSLRNFLPLLLIALFWLTAGLAQAQTPEPTAVATPNETPEASATPEAAATDAPVIEVTVEAPDNSVSSEAYDSMLTSLTVIFLALLGTVGAVGGVGVWRAIGILLIVVEVWARFTDNKNDDVEVAKWRKAYDEKMMAQAVKAGVAEAIEDGKTQLREDREAQAVNKTLNLTQPPHNPVS
jgi:hypothetical protein